MIAPYQSQIKYLNNQMNESNVKMEKVKVSTVDAFQGQERDVIIMTCVRSNSKNDVGFVKCEKRMNVSITRAKYALFVLGDQKTLSNFKSRGANYWELFIKSQEKNNSLIYAKNKQEMKQGIRSIVK